MLGFRRVPFANAKSGSNSVTGPPIRIGIIIFTVFITGRIDCPIIQYRAVIGGVVGRIINRAVLCGCAELICSILLCILKIYADIAATGIIDDGMDFGLSVHKD